MISPLSLVMHAAEQQLGDLIIYRDRLEGFLSLGNEVNRAKVLDQKIKELREALETLRISDVSLDDLIETFHKAGTESPGSNSVQSNRVMVELWRHEWKLVANTLRSLRL